MSGDENLVSFLLDNGAEVNARSTEDDPSTALYYAEGNGHKRAAAILRERGGVK